MTALVGSARRVRINKKREFSAALIALGKLSVGSAYLPDEIYSAVTKAADEMRFTRDQWIFRHRSAIVLPLYKQLEFHFYNLNQKGQWNECIQGGI